MKISVDEIPQSPKEITFSESIEELNEIYRRSNSRDFRFPPRLRRRLDLLPLGAGDFFERSFSRIIQGVLRALFGELRLYFK